MATILATGNWRGGVLRHDTTFANPDHAVIGQVGDVVLNHDLGIKFVIGAVRVDGKKAWYTAAEGTVEVIGPDAAAEEERLGGSIPRLPGDRFE